MNFTIKIKNAQGGTIINNFYDCDTTEEKVKKKLEKIEEKNSSEEDIKLFEERKLQSLRIGDAFLFLNLISKAERIHQCGNHLEFWKFKKNEKQKLVKANFCRERLCPACAWRRSLKTYVENKKCFNVLGKEGQFIFLTLTCRNVKAEDLREEVKKYFSGFGMLMKKKRIKENVLGFIRAFEVTYNKENKTYHPHLHCLLQVRPNYFGKGYINQKEWTSMWKEVAELDYEPVVDVRKFGIKTGNIANEMAELSKYCTKFSEILSLGQKEFYEVVKVLNNTLTSRRLITYAGTFRDARKELHMRDDIADEIEDVDFEKDEGYKIIYEWNFGQKKYIDVTEKN